MDSEREQCKKFLIEFRSIFKNAEVNSQRGRDCHIRVTRFDEDELINFLNIYKGSIHSHEKDTRYSSSYKTYLLNINQLLIPIVISQRNSKVNDKDSIIQKELTPKKLNMTGTFTDLSEYLINLETNLNKVKPQLSDYWNSTDDTELCNLLLKLAYQASGTNVAYTTREEDILSKHKFSIGKDYGEILSACYILSQHNNVTITDNESTGNYDLYFYDDTNLINRFNTKSGTGSGQSFKSLENELKSIVEDDYLKGSTSAIFIDMIKSITRKEKGINGRIKMFNVCELATQLPSNLGSFFCDIKKEFFNNEIICESNYIAKENFNTFKEFCFDLLKKHNIESRGIAKGSDSKSPDELYEQNDIFKANVILFFMLTILAHNFDDKVVTNVIQKILRTKIHILHIDISRSGVNITQPKEITYSLHYWGSAFAPTNNLLGFKSIY